MKIGHILVVHTVDPLKLFESVPKTDEAEWFVFHHGNSDDMASRLRSYLDGRRGCVFDYRSNRGLARSWNEGIKNSLDTGCEAFFLLNDDIFFYPEAYDLFLKQAHEVLTTEPEVALISPNGFERSGPHAGEVHNQSYSCCIIPSGTIERIGYFDTVFWPAYFEDVDYARRIGLAGMKTYLDERILVEHDRSSTLRNNVDLQKDHSQLFFQNKERYENKWGREGVEFFATPYNDPSRKIYMGFDQS